MDSGENFILKKIRYYQGSVNDFASYWEERSNEGRKKLSKKTRALKKKNDDLNKSYTIIPVEKD